MLILYQKNSKEHSDLAEDQAFQRFCAVKLITVWALLMSFAGKFSVDPQEAGWKPLAGLTGRQIGSRAIVHSHWSTPLL